MELDLKLVAYADWPPKVQQVFDLYMLQDKPSTHTLAKHPDVKQSASTLDKWGAKYHWQDERARRLRQNVEEARKKQDATRLAALENMDRGLANGAAAFGLMASGRCPMCAGSGKVARHSDKTVIECPKCAGSGLFDVSKIPSKSLAIFFDRLEKVWGYSRITTEGEDSTQITPQQQNDLAMEMMKRAGIGVLAELEAAAAAAGRPAAVPVETEE